MSEPAPTSFPRPVGVSLLAALNLLAGLTHLAIAVLLLFFGATPPEGDAGPVAARVAGVLLLGAGLFHLVNAIALWRLNPFGRVLQMVQSGVWLFVFPLGTIVSALILYYLTRPGMKLLFSGQPPASMTPEARKLVERDASQIAVVVVTAVLVIVGGLFFLGLVVSMAIPAIVQARISANEAAAIARVRAIASAQEAWASTHDRRYARLPCLAMPTLCTPPGQPVPSALLDTDALMSPRHGFTFDLRVTDDGSRFVYWASPQTPGTSGSRQFCASGTDVFEYGPAHVPPPVDAAQGCPAGGRRM